jgi:hypothetical protein
VFSWHKQSPRAPDETLRYSSLVQAFLLEGVVLVIGDPNACSVVGQVRRAYQLRFSHRFVDSLSFLIGHIFSVAPAIYFVGTRV